MTRQYISERRTVFHADAHTAAQELVPVYGGDAITTDADPENESRVGPVTVPRSDANPPT